MFKEKDLVKGERILSKVFQLKPDHPDAGML
jgi:hypothetical protein